MQENGKILSFDATGYISNHTERSTPIFKLSLEEAKGKINKGIRNTILNEPSMFFAYNNGIAATASNISLSESNGSLFITEITALQIVNGGQTTASLAMALACKRGLFLVVPYWIVMTISYFLY